jgi:hypothetical protein
MISNDEKIDILINKLETLQFIIKSYIDHAEEFKNKYSLEDVLSDCNSIKIDLLKELESLGGSWAESL